MAFSVELRTAHNVSAWTSLDANQSKHASLLQRLYDKGMSDQYNAEKAALEKGGIKIRLTEGKVFEVLDKGEKVNTRIMFQVKGGTITWYFLSPHDVTKQEFRDEVFRSAALSHMEVEGHCEKYWRGTNSLHVKKMHTSENESGLNHNHYRMDDDRVADPKAVRQHLLGFVKAQNEMAKNGLIEKANKFIDQAEALELSARFEVFYYTANHSGPAKTVTLSNGTELQLPAKEVSDVEKYGQRPNQKFTKEDEQEWAQYKHLEQPCISIKEWEKMDFATRLDSVNEAMRGIGSNLAHTRQLEGSKFKTQIAVVKTDDELDTKERTPPPVMISAAAATSSSSSSTVNESTSTESLYTQTTTLQPVDDEEEEEEIGGMQFCAIL